MKPDQVAYFQEYTELRLKQENPARIEKLEVTLVQMNKGLIFYVARRYPALKFHTDEVVTVGMATLLKAVRTYDPAEGDFAPWAVQQLRSSDGLQSIDRFHVCGPIKIPHNAFVNYLTEKRKRAKEAAESHDFSDEALAVDTAINNISRFGVEAGDNSPSLEDIVEQNTFESPVVRIEKSEMSCLLSSTMSTLANREQLVLHLLFGMDENTGELDLRTVGERLSISHEAVRKIRDKALEKLRKKMLKSIRVG